ncbi:hypothetical protein VTO42DRAFT_5594 [Malbranchea cinnamomea]
MACSLENEGKMVSSQATTIPVAISDKLWKRKQLSLSVQLRLFGVKSVLIGNFGSQLEWPWLASAPHRLLDGPSLLGPAGVVKAALLFVIYSPINVLTGNGEPFTLSLPIGFDIKRRLKISQQSSLSSAIVVDDLILVLSKRE